MVEGGQRKDNSLNGGGGQGAGKKGRRSEKARGGRGQRRGESVGALSKVMKEKKQKRGGGLNLPVEDGGSEKKKGRITGRKKILR